ncbi:MAG: TolC family protein [Pseudomonadota bacterium]
MNCNFVRIILLILICFQSISASYAEENLTVTESEDGRMIIAKTERQENVKADGFTLDLNTQSHPLPLPLKDYLDYIEKTHHAITFLETRRDIAAENLDAAALGRRPQIGIQGFMGRNRTEDKTISETFDGAARFHELTVSQPIYTGGRVDSEILNAKAGYDEADFRTKGDVNSFLFDAAEAYTEFHKNKNLVILYTDTVQNAQKRVRSVEAENKAGERTITDVAIAKSRLASAEADLARASADLKSSRVKFTYYTGQSNTPFQTVENSARPLDVAQDFIPADLGAFYFLNPSIREADAATHAAEAGIERAKAEYAPSVTLDGRAAYNDRRDELARNIDSEDYSLFARYNIPIYSRGMEYSRLRTARLEAKRAKNRLIALSGEASTDYQSSILRYNASTSIVRSYEIALETAQKAYDAAQKEYEYGFRTITEVSDAEREVTRARAELISAKADRLNNVLEILRDLDRLRQG